MLVLLVISTGDCAHCPVTAEQKVVQVVLVTQAVPPVLQVCESLPEQRKSPGVQAPVQRPLEQPEAQVSS
jgi:hypothetical protein